MREPRSQSPTWQPRRLDPRSVVDGALPELHRTAGSAVPASMALKCPPLSNWLEQRLRSTGEILEFDRRKTSEQPAKWAQTRRTLCRHSVHEPTQMADGNPWLGETGRNSSPRDLTGRYSNPCAVSTISSNPATLTYQSWRRFTASAAAELNRKVERSRIGWWPWIEGRQSRPTQPRAKVASAVTNWFPLSVRGLAEHEQKVPVGAWPSRSVPLRVAVDDLRGSETPRRWAEPRHPTLGRQRPILLTFSAPSRHCSSTVIAGRSPLCHSRATLDLALDQ